MANSDRVYIAHSDNYNRRYHRSKGCIHLRYARRRNTIVVLPIDLAKRAGDQPCKTCYKGD